MNLYFRLSGVLMILLISCTETTNDSEQSESISETSNQEKIDELGNAGVDLFYESKYTEALNKFEEILELDNQNCEAMLWKADCLDLLRRHEESIDSYTDAIDCEPNNKTLYYNRALTYESMFDFSSAINDYNQAISMDPEDQQIPSNEDVMENLGIALGENQQYDSAITVFKTIFEMNPKNSDSQYNIGYAFKKKGELDSAKVYLGKAVEMNPEHLTYREELNSLSN